MTSPRTRRGVLVFVATLLVCLVLAAPAMAGRPTPTPTPTPTPSGQWVTGDTHNHTHLSDGQEYLPELVRQAFAVWGLDYLGSTDHGGEWDRDANGVKYNYPDIIGNGTGDVWAWDGMLDNWDTFNALRATYPSKILFQGLEWGVPGIDESKTVVLDQYQLPGSAKPTYATGMAESDFEYLFDKMDSDYTQAKTIGGVPGTTESRTGIDKTAENYDKYAWGLEAANFLGTRYANSSYSILSHPSRDLLWTAADIRRYNDKAPTVFFGMAGIPGSQKELPSRGGYDTDDEWFNPDGSIDWSITRLARTYGGADYITAQLGGVWDSLLGEGRKYWIFSDSDFHNSTEEFWPGEYSKDYVWVDAKTPQGIIDGLRRGNSFSVEAQLIDGLDFKAAASTGSATMGGTLNVAKGATVTVTVKWHSPAVNNHGDVPKVNHVDLISGNVTGKISPTSPAYTTQVTNSSTKVAARFTTASLKASKGWYSSTFTIKPTADMYFRLRGTNQGLNVFNQTDANGNPLMDDLEGLNDNVKCWMDIWFYSNPIFINVP
jgi:hypothetical protein